MVPKIEKIHAKVFLAANQENALDMGEWHSCNTTHCRAGWVVFLAGDEGRALEYFFGTALAAAKIYKKSSGIEVKWALRFFEGNNEALSDMKRCAKEEQEEEQKEK